MRLPLGARLGPYEIVSALGAGGMGEVYRARDTSLGRDVAIKVLLPEVADNPERLARFQREAQLLAALNHPHIAAIYGLEKSDGVSALVIELVEGEDLSERIGRGAIPLRDGLRLAAQIIEALEAAHDQGIVHRDLKPANIKVRADGMVKVLDFGLAKAIAPGSGTGSTSSRSASIAPTITSPAAMTGVGVILGTAAYMSPEQARGGTVDRRADLWAFGAILFEMLAGRRLFEGDTVSDTLASVLKSEPDWSLLPTDTPAAIRRLLRRCLEKDRRERLDSAADARLEIREALAPAPPEAGAAATGSPATARLPWLIAATTTIAAVGLLVAFMSRSRVPIVVDQPPMVLEIAPPDGTTFGPIRSSFRPVAISPDGRQLAIVAGRPDGPPMLWIRPLASDTARVIAGTENAAHPFWSADGRLVGFLASGKIKRVDVNGGQPQIVGDANRAGGAFDRGGALLLTRNGQPILRVPPAGGNPAPLFPLDTARKETGQYDPVILPGGNHLLYFSTGPEAGLAYASLDGAVRKFLFQHRDSPADYAPDPAGGGWLLYNVQGQLSAQRFNPATGDVSGEPARVADDVAGGPSISVSDNGVLTFRHLRQPARQLVWYARDGKEQSAVGESGTTIGRFSINPDGKSVAVVRTIEGRSDIWLEGSDGGSTTRLTFESAVDSAPVWSLDGQRLYYTSTRDGGAQVVERPANGLGAERVLHREPGIVYRPLSISRDGGWLVLRMGGAGESALSFLSLADGKMVRLQEGARVNYGSLSPDGRWLAYEMRTAAVSDVFVRGAPAELNRSTVDAKQQISAGGGLRPQWRADGKEIVYVTPDGSVTSVPVEITNAGLRTGPPRVLFKLAGGAPLDMSADGQRFLVGRAISESDPPVTVIVNWPKLLRQ